MFQICGGESGEHQLGLDEYLNVAKEASERREQQHLEGVIVFEEQFQQMNSWTKLIL